MDFSNSAAGIKDSPFHVSIDDFRKLFSVFGLVLLCNRCAWQFEVSVFKGLALSDQGVCIQTRSDRVLTGSRQLLRQLNLLTLQHTGNRLPEFKLPSISLSFETN